MKSTYAIRFYCKQSKADKYGLARVQVSIIINGERAFINLPMKFKPDEFKRQRKSVKDNPVNSYCNAIERRLNEINQELTERGIPLTAEILKDYFQNGGVAKIYTLNDLFTDALMIQQERVGSDLTEDTFNRYKKARDFFYKFNQVKPETPARMITKEHFLKVQIGLNKTYDPATSCNYLQKLKAMFKYAFACGNIPSDPFFGLKINKGIKDTVLFLTPSELNQIRAKEMPNERLERVKDIFLFSCYTGLAFSDLKLLTPEDFKENEKGQVYIEKHRKKSGVKFTTVLLQDAWEIGRKYNYQLPNSNRKIKIGGMNWKIIPRQNPTIIGRSIMNPKKTVMMIGKKNRNRIGAMIGENTNLVSSKSCPDAF